MVRPRFAKLPEQQQEVILRAAREEFAAHGFHDASLNRVIDAAGISKGSMYYYFDGKEDLYAYVARVEVERLLTSLGPFPVPTEGGPEEFWSTLESYYLRLMTALSDSPQMASLIRGWVVASSVPALQNAEREMSQAVVPWMEDAIGAGQQIGAVRTDLPVGLLIAVVTGMGQAMDTWLLTRRAKRTDLPALIGALIGMIRRAVQP
jgi:AcrR family transcriptional regulator